MPPWVYANSLFAVSPLPTIRTCFCLLIEVPIVDPNRRALAIRRRNVLPFSQAIPLHLHRIPPRPPLRR